jgi:hypothetical protein
LLFAPLLKLHGLLDVGITRANTAHMKRFFLTLCLLSNAACTSAASSDVKTSGISASYLVATNQEDPSANVSATFQFGSTYLDLVAGDDVLCDGKLLTRQKNVLGKISYEGTVPKHVPGALYTFEFRRKGENIKSSIAQPTPLALIAPAQNAELKASQETRVTWSGTSDETEVRISEPGCVSSGLVMEQKNEAVIQVGNLTFSEGKTTCPNAKLALESVVRSSNVLTLKETKLEVRSTSETTVRVTQ